MLQILLIQSFIDFVTIAINCGHPGRPRHGNITESGFTYKKVVRFFCHRYYELRGERTRQCQADGKWSGEQPKCVASKLSFGAFCGHQPLLLRIFLLVVVSQLGIEFILEQEWRSGESTRFPPMWPGFDSQT